MFEILDIIKKNDVNCSECPFYSDPILRSRQPVVIPYSRPLRLMIISRDPPMDFLMWYDYSMKNYEPEVARKVLFASAIPFKVLFSLRRFSKGHLNELGWKESQFEDNILSIQRLLASAYWTHFNKCPTGEGKGTGFKKTCAKAFLGKELQWAKDNDVQKVLALGVPVHDWLDANNTVFAKPDIIKIPHPSGANNAEWFTKEKSKVLDLASSINSLLELASE